MLMEPRYPIALRPERGLTFHTFDCRISTRRARATAAWYVTSGSPVGAPTLVLTGVAGSGKTHLLNAAAILAGENGMAASLSLLPAWRLAAEYDEAQVFDDWQLWRLRFEEEDLLAIDDIHTLCKHPGLADELLNIIKARSRAIRKTIVTMAAPDSTRGDGPLETYLLSQQLVMMGK